MELELFSYISKNSFLNFKRNLKHETFDQGTFLYKVHELLLITLQSGGSLMYSRKIAGPTVDP